MSFRGTVSTDMKTEVEERRVRENMGDNFDETVPVVTVGVVM